jgi:hypothetical protein
VENCDFEWDKKIEAGNDFKVLMVEVSKAIFVAEGLEMKGEMLNKRVNQAETVGVNEREKQMILFIQAGTAEEVKRERERQ